MSATAPKTDIKERPLVLRANEVRAVLEGRKTQHRVLVTIPQWLLKMSPDVDRMHPGKAMGVTPCLFVCCADGSQQRLRNPFGWPDVTPSRLWVREALRWTDYLVYDADREPVDPNQIPAGIRIGRDYLPMTHMPRWASRITLEITNIRVQRIQDISAADAKAEGIEPFLNRDATAWRAGFQLGWNEINAKRGYSWESNPWVWVIEFKKL